MRYLDLFTGIAGISRCVQRSRNMECAAYVEIHPPAQRIVRARMASGDLQPAPVVSDVRAVRGEDTGPVDMICGGFPCQDLSMAGARKGLAGERSCLVFEMLRLLKETGARWFMAENVDRFLGNGFDRVRDDLETLGFEVRHVMVRANECGMRHRRRRIFVLARRKQSALRSAGATLPSPLTEDYAEPEVRVVREKGAQWVPRIHGLGNACSPVQCDEAIRRMLGYPDPGISWDDAWDASRESWKDPSRRSTLEKVPLSCPTPIASDAKGGAGPNRRVNGRCTCFSLARWIRVRPGTGVWGLACTEKEYAERTRGVYVSPNWTEWLMGFPQGWTRIEPAGHVTLRAQKK